MRTRRWMAGAAAAGLLWLVACSVPAPVVELPPATGPLLPYAGAVAARFPEPSERHRTPGLAPGRADYTTDDELHARLAELAARPGKGGSRIERLALGWSQQQRPIEALHFARATGRPRVLLVGQQHGDEPAGSEALLVIAGELASGDLARVLDRIDVIVLPRANPDGARWNSRVAVDGVDINRDHLLLRTPEAQAQALLARQWRPVVVADLHEHTVVGRYLEKFNAVQRNDMLLQYAMTANLPAELSRVSDAWFHQPVRAALAREGLTSEWYYTNPTPPGDLRLNMGGAQPDTGRNVNGLKHSVSLLLESRGVGIGRLHLQRRVHSHVVALRSVLASAAEHADELLALQRRLDAEVSAQACRGDVVVLAAGTPQRRELLMLDPVTGADRAVPVDWTSSLELRVLRRRARPCGYWLAPEAGDAVARLRAVGVRVRRFAAATELQAEAWRETSRREGAREDVRGAVADGTQSTVQVQVELQARRAVAPEGSWYVSLDQPLAHLAVAALEPDTQNSYFANRALPDLQSALRVLAVPAARWSVAADD